MVSKALIPLAALAAAAIACVGEREEARWVPASRSIADEERGPSRDLRPIAEASTFSVTRERCDRERRCENIGPGKTFESREACIRFLNDRNFDAFGPSACPTGVDQDAISECARSVRDGRCDTVPTG